MSKDEKVERDSRLREKYPDIFNSTTSTVPTPKKVPPAITTCTCIDCKQTYERTTYFVMGVKLDFDGGRCPECKKKNALAEAAKQEARKQAAIRVQRTNWWKQSGVPSKFLTKSFQDYKKELHPTAYTRCREYAEKFPLKDFRNYPSLMLYSENSWGVGKTHLVTSICRRILERWDGEGSRWDEEAGQLICIRRNPVKFITEPDMFASIMATFNYTYEQKQLLPTEDQIINHLISVPLLVMDDIGKQEVSDMRFVQRTLFRIIDARWSNGLPMVLTANLNQERLRYHFGGGVGNEAAFDRLKAMVKGKFLQVDGDSYRLKEV